MKKIKKKPINARKTQKLSTASKAIYVTSKKMICISIYVILLALVNAIDIAARKMLSE